nr:diguanylate cyclase [Bradyrhizobium australiense]
MLCVDVDQFREINDVYGHSTGDKFLVEIGHRLMSICNGPLLRWRHPFAAWCLQDCSFRWRKRPARSSRSMNGCCAKPAGEAASWR